jgi:undecaprenyl pyrophosphate synthase
MMAIETGGREVSNVSTPRLSAAPEVFVLPELRDARQADMGILILPDGNRRSDPSEGGYEKGARKVVEVAEHLARRPDVASMVACVMSPENVAARSDAFFASLLRGFERLAEGMAWRGTLIDAGVRARLCGDLSALRARGETAARLADAIEVVIKLSGRVERPNLHLYFGVGYPNSTPRDLDVDVVLRTGVEGGDAVRLSGLCSHPSIANFGLTTLWPDVTTADVDAAIEAAKGRKGPRFSMGYGPAAAAAIARALEAARLGPGLRVTLPSYAPRAALEAAFRPPSARRRAVAVEVVGEGGAPARFGAARHARHRLRVVAGGAKVPASDGDDFAAVLAPGQRGPLLVLPEWHYGYATIHACEATPAGIVDGLGAAELFARTHVALRGAERAAAPAARTSNEGASR